MATFTPTTNPMIIPAPALTATTTIVLSRPILAKRIEWYVPTTIGGTIKITDASSSLNIIDEGTCEVASQSQILWSSPQKLTLPGKSGTTSSWQVVNAYAAASSAALIIWF